MNLWVFVVIALVLGQVIWMWTRSMTSSLLAIAIILAVKVPWFWIAVVPLALWRINQCFLHSSSPWRRVHFRMMRVHASAAGLERVHAEQEKREWDIRNVLISMVLEAHRDWTLPQVLLFVSQELAKMQNFEDRPLVKEFILKKHKQTDEAEVERFLDDIQSKLNMTDNGLLTRTIIAGLIEKKYGKQNKGEYLYAMFTGKAI